MKKLIAVLFATSIAFASAPVFACGGADHDEATTTSGGETAQTDTKKDAKKTKADKDKKKQAQSEEETKSPTS